MAEPTPQTNFKHFTALQERVGKVQIALAALALTVAGLGSWQVVVNGEVNDLQKRVVVLETQNAPPEAIGSDYELAGLLSTASPTPRLTCAAWDASPEPYARCSYLGNDSVEVKALPLEKGEASLFLQGPESLKVEVWAKKIGGTE